MVVNPDDKEAVYLFVERSQSGDPVRDWYSETDLTESLRLAYAYIKGLEMGIRHANTAVNSQGAKDED